jgi:hypothetical protein
VFVFILNPERVLVIKVEQIYMTIKIEVTTISLAFLLPKPIGFGKITATFSENQYILSEWWTFELITLRVDSPASIGVFHPYVDISLLDSSYIHSREYNTLAIGISS